MHRYYSNTYSLTGNIPLPATFPLPTVVLDLKTPSRTSWDDDEDVIPSRRNWDAPSPARSDISRKDRSERR